MHTALTVIQSVSALFLVITILMQNRGTGVGAAFGGEGNVYRTKRGAEKILFSLTIGLAIIFLGSVFAPLVLPS